MSRSNRCFISCTTILLSIVLVLGLTPSLPAIPHFYFDDLGFTPWRASWPQALREAQLTGKPIYVQITHRNCKVSTSFCLDILSDYKVQNLLRRYFVCYAGDFHKLPPDLANIRAMKGYTDGQTPLHLLLNPKSETLGWLVQNPPPEEFARFLKQAASDKQFKMNKQQEKEMEKAVSNLEKALESNDAKKIATAWQNVLKHPGYSDAKNKGFDLMDAAEDPARKKLFEAAKLVRAQKYPQAQLALEEARQLCTNLPISHEVQQTLSCMKLLQTANDADRLATTVKQKQNVMVQFQQILNKYPENALATVAYQKLLKINKDK